MTETIVIALGRSDRRNLWRRFEGASPVVLACVLIGAVRFAFSGADSGHGAAVHAAALGAMAMLAIGKRFLRDGSSHRTHTDGGSMDPRIACHWVRWRPLVQIVNHKAQPAPWAMAEKIDIASSWAGLC
jgi:hypothetical protein